MNVSTKILPDSEVEDFHSFFSFFGFLLAKGKKLGTTPNLRRVRTVTEVAAGLGLSRSRVQQIERSALKKLRLHAERLGLDAFLTH